MSTFVIEVEIAGQVSWLMEEPGQFFNAPFYGFHANRAMAHEYTTKEAAQKAANRNWVYCPVIHEEKDS